MAGNVEGLLRSFGTNSNSFLALYPGYNYFYLDNPEQGCIPYLRTRSAWIGLAEPLGKPEARMELLKAFAREAAAEKRAAVMLPVERDFRNAAEAGGFKSFQIGSEPYFDLSQYPGPGRDWLDISHSAKSLKISKGFTVQEFNIEETSRAMRLELGQMLQDWIDSRKTGELGFVNRVEPYTLPQFKKYFMIEGQDRIWAFVACIPIWATGGWYFIDVIRRRDSPAGCVELLMLEAMKILRNQGAKWVSLGVSPLAKLEPEGAPGGSLIAKVTPMFFSRFQWFYNFQSLYRFKAKFHPTEWRSAYVIHNLGRTDFRLAAVLTEAFVPQGPLAAFIQMLGRKLDLRAYLRQMNRWVVDGVLLRKGIDRPFDLIFRAPASFTLMLAWLVFFAAYGQAKSGIGFSFRAVENANSLAQIWALLGRPGFLHWNSGHLFLNALTFLMVGVTLEIFCGPLLLILTYGIGHIFANALTGLLFWTFSKALPLDVFTSTLSTEDVGASLGIFGCAGVWGYLLKNRLTVWTIFPAVILAVAFFRNDYFQINHIVAAVLGFCVARFYFGKTCYAES